MGKLFGTDGVRGIANKELTCKLTYEVGKAGSFVLAKKENHKPKILVATDTRISCDMLKNALVSGILSAGGDAYILGVVPTPAVAYLVRKYNADAGVMISASHNPMEYNGIKFFNRDGFKLSDELEAEIEELIFNDLRDVPSPTGEELGRVYYYENSLKDYCDFIKSTASCNLDGLKIVMDCANGATYKAAEEVFLNLGAEVKVINNEPNGININLCCGSTHINKLCEEIKKGNFDIGLAFDGDGDRMLAVDKYGNLVDGDVIIAIIAKYLKDKGELKNNTVVGTVMSNLGLKIMCEENDIDIILSKVGDRYVLEEMLSGEYVLGGEQSGHVILLNHNTTGDGIMTALKLLCIIKEKNMGIEELEKIMTVMPQVLKNVNVRNDLKMKIINDKEVLFKVNEIEKALNGKGRVLLRPSGTEPIVRIMIEGNDINTIEEQANCLADLINSKIKEKKICAE